MSYECNWQPPAVTVDTSACPEPTAVERLAAIVAAHKRAVRIKPVHPEQWWDLRRCVTWLGRPGR